MDVHELDASLYLPGITVQPGSRVKIFLIACRKSMGCLGHTFLRQSDVGKPLAEH